jgi:hypothetical protein
VENTDDAIEFYERLGFEVQMHPAPGLAMLRRQDLQLLLNTAGGGGAGHAMPDGTLPKPGEWNRIQLEVGGLEATVQHFSGAGVTFRGDIITGTGGKPVLANDPSGKPISFKLSVVESS